MRKEQLKAWRKKAGITQAELGEILGYTRWAIARWEQGKEKIPKWMDLIKATGVIQKRFF